ncbi:thioredoxin domain-containing protein [Chlamydiifrater phoenicopteri]|uniref:thioredoxin domain-containing protein n=1 Tax=Chlamydiifrater phoenicopteri TaxID=2681469 RepID=UPI001FE56F08|nr:DsbA family protein [Chlamydiifrater phoenicopteri]
MNKKTLTLLTAAVFLLSAGVMMKIKHSMLPPKIGVKIDVRRFPTIGNLAAPINITLFEEPSCHACEEFSSEVFPKIKKDFIDTGEVSFTLIPVCFIEGSMPAAQSLMCIFHHNSKQPDPEAFVEYFHRILKYRKVEGEEWATPEVLGNLAENLPTNSGRTINSEGLRQCVASNIHRETIKQNNIYATGLMNGQLATPTAIIGGRLIEDPTYDEVSRVVRVLKKKLEKGKDIYE